MIVPTLCYGTVIAGGRALLDDGQKVTFYNDLGGEPRIGARVLIMPAFVAGKEEWVVMAAGV